MRDNQQSALYRSEDTLAKVMDNSHDFPTMEIHGSRLTISNDRKFADIQSVQTYVDRVLGLNWVRNTWDMASHKVTVRPRKGNTKAHYEHAGSVIAVPEIHRGGKWALRELVILHEIAHHLTKIDARQAHGPIFAGTLIKLIEEIVSPENAFTLKSFMTENNVSFTLLD